MSIMRGTKPSPNSVCKRSASSCLRTEPNTRNPFETSTFVVPQPIPLETPVTTTSLLFGIVFPPVIMITTHLTFLLCNRAQPAELNGFVPYGSGNHGAVQQDGSVLTKNDASYGNCQFRKLLT